MKLFFKLSDFLRTWTRNEWKEFEAPSKEVLDYIVSGHFIPLNLIRIACGLPIRASSCYRPDEHELQRGRDGSSQHTFKDHGFEGERGATDYTFWFERHRTLKNFLKMCDESTKHYDRICFYPQEKFLHGDYKSSTKQYFVAEYAFNDEAQAWVISGWKYYDNKKAWLVAVEDEYKRFNN